MLPLAMGTTAGVETTEVVEVTGVAEDTLLEESDCITGGEKRRKWEALLDRRFS